MPIHQNGAAIFTKKPKAKQSSVVVVDPTHGQVGWLDDKDRYAIFFNGVGWIAKDELNELRSLQGNTHICGVVYASRKGFVRALELLGNCGWKYLPAKNNHRRIRVYFCARHGWLTERELEMHLEEQGENSEARYLQNLQQHGTPLISPD